jgi:hypothetical protein
MLICADKAIIVIILKQLSKTHVQLVLTCQEQEQKQLMIVSLVLQDINAQILVQ